MTCRPFVPKTVYVTDKALKYPETARITEAFRRAGSAVVRGTPRLPRDLTPAARFARAKTVVVLTAEESPFFRNCKPSAEYELNLVRGCPGMCEYCYLQTTAGPSPYTKVYVDVEEILQQAATLCRARNGLATFEASSQGDPILARCPESRLPMSEAGRHPRRGRFGTEKYVYPAERLKEAREAMLRMAAEILPEARVEYFV